MAELRRHPHDVCLAKTGGHHCLGHVNHNVDFLSILKLDNRLIRCNSLSLVDQSLGDDAAERGAQGAVVQLDFRFLQAAFERVNLALLGPDLFLARRRSFFYQLQSRFTVLLSNAVRRLGKLVVRSGDGTGGKQPRVALEFGARICQFRVRCPQLRFSSHLLLRSFAELQSIEDRQPLIQLAASRLVPGFEFILPELADHLAAGDPLALLYQQLGDQAWHLEREVYGFRGFHSSRKVTYIRSITCSYHHGFDRANFFGLSGILPRAPGGETGYQQSKQPTPLVWTYDVHDSASDGGAL
jgi:hypothetical protein